MNPSEDTELIAWMKTAFEERDLVPILTHFINEKYKMSHLFKLILNSIPDAYKWVSAVN